MKSLVRAQTICPKCNKPYCGEGDKMCPDCIKLERTVKLNYSIEMFYNFNIGRVESLAAEYANVHIVCPKYTNRHHWSYSRDNWGDVIILDCGIHFRAHDRLRKHGYVFKTPDGVLLDTKQKHLDYLGSIGVSPVESF